VSLSLLCSVSCCRVYALRKNGQDHNHSATVSGENQSHFGWGTGTRSEWLIEIETGGMLYSFSLFLLSIRRFSFRLISVFVWFLYSFVCCIYVQDTGREDVVISPWDVAFCTKKLKKRLDIDETEIQKYFPISHVTEQACWRLVA
jgi:hypothetical protein